MENSINRDFKSFDKNTAETFVKINAKYGISSQKLKDEVVRLIQKGIKQEQELIRDFEKKLKAQILQNNLHSSTLTKGENLSL